ncbi:MAG: DUF4003 family protein, partial [Clostridia bacterium]|nr:DUF4003 family protein [Clostridia bacterium]
LAEDPEKYLDDVIDIYKKLVSDKKIPGETYVMTAITIYEQAGDKDIDDIIAKTKEAYAKIKEHLVVLYRIKNSSKWKYSLDNEFCVEVFESREAAVDAAFETLDKVIYRN